MACHPSQAYDTRWYRGWYRAHLHSCTTCNTWKNSPFGGLLYRTLPNVPRLCIPVFVPFLGGPESGAGFWFRSGFRQNPVGTYPDVPAFQKAGTLVPYQNRNTFRSHWTGILLTYMHRSWYTPYQRSKNFHSALTTHTNHCSLIYHCNNGKD